MGFIVSRVPKAKHSGSQPLTQVSMKKAIQPAAVCLFELTEARSNLPERMRFLRFFSGWPINTSAEMPSSFRTRRIIASVSERRRVITSETRARLPISGSRFFLVSPCCSMRN